MYAILESLVMYVLLECFWVVTLIRKKKGHVVSGRYVTLTHQSTQVFALVFAETSHCLLFIAMQVLQLG